VGVTGVATICIVQLNKPVSNISVRINKRKNRLSDTIIAVFPSVYYRVRIFIHRSQDERDCPSIEQVRIGRQNLAVFAIIPKKRHLSRDKIDGTIIRRDQLMLFKKLIWIPSRLQYPVYLFKEH
jgi:hypothetical protein